MGKVTVVECGRCGAKDCANLRGPCYVVAVWEQLMTDSE